MATAGDADRVLTEMADLAENPSYLIRLSFVQGLKDAFQAIQFKQGCILQTLIEKFTNDPVPNVRLALLDVNEKSYSDTFLLDDTVLRVSKGEKRLDLLRDEGRRPGAPGR